MLGRWLGFPNRCRARRRDGTFPPADVVVLREPPGELGSELGEDLGDCPALPSGVRGAFGFGHPSSTWSFKATSPRLYAARAWSGVLNR